MKKNYYDLVKIYIFSYAAIGVLFPLIGQYLHTIGFSGAQIGMITATCTAVGIVAGPAWGCIYHNSQNSRNVILFLCIAAAMAVLGLQFIGQFLIFLLAYGIFSFFQTPIMPLNDAMVLQARAPFGAVRKWGAIGYAVGVFVAGLIADRFSLNVILPLSAVGFILTGTFIFRMIKSDGLIRNKKEEAGRQDGIKNILIRSKKCGDNRTGRRNKGYNELIKNKRFVALLISAFFIGGTNVAHNTYFGFLYTDSGGSLAGIGLAFLLMAGSEAPFMAWTVRISNKITMEKAILISMMISMGRYLWYSTGPSSELLIATFFLQGMVNGIVLVELVRYIAKLVEPSMIGLAMTLYQAFSSNCSTILCQLIGGTVLEKFGSTSVYLFFGMFNAVGILSYLFFGLHKEKQ